MTTKTVKLTIEILSYWHAGSGIGRGGDVAALVLKDRYGLPYLPGRTVKGLLREGWQGCEDLGRIPAGRTAMFFGKPSAEGDPSGVFSDAVMNHEEHEWLAHTEQAGVREALFDRFASTSIDKKGVADDNALRTIELAIPLTLTADITGPAGDAGWLTDLETACVLVRGLGSHRNRGLGRCRLSIGEQ